jgi:hypothetical protein
MVSNNFDQRVAVLPLHRLDDPPMIAFNLLQMSRFGILDCADQMSLLRVFHDALGQLGVLTGHKLFAVKLDIQPEDNAQVMFGDRL